MSALSRAWYEKTARVAEVARGFERPVMERVARVEERVGVRIPTPVKEVGVGVAITGPAAAVEMAGMIPGGLEVIARRPGIIVPAAVVGTWEMGRGMWEGVTTDPFKTAGEFIAFGAITRGLPKVRVPARVLPPKVPTPPGLPPGKVIKFEAGLEVARRLGEVKAPIREPLKFEEVKYLPRGSGTTVETWIKAHPGQDPVIFGSAAARAQLRGARIPKDIDIFVKKPHEAASQIRTVLAKRLGSGNVRVTKRDTSSIVETKVKGEWRHAVDIHPRAEMAGRLGLGLATQTPIKIGGIKYIPIGEQLARKAASVLQPRGREIGPKPHRMKDIEDFMAISRELAAKEQATAGEALLFRQRKVSKAIETQRLITEYEFHAGLYPEPVIRAYVKLPPGVRRPPPIMLAAYRMPRPPKEPAYPPAVPPIKYPPAVLLTKYPPGVPPIKYPLMAPPPEYPPGVPPVKYPPVVPPVKYPPVIPPYEPPPIPPAIPPIKPPTYRPPKIPDEDKRKRALRKRRKAEAEWWRLENPIAALDEIMIGRRMEGLPEKKSKRKR
jgi:hypothetical protein